jgi:hypothetical protein
MLWQRALVHKLNHCKSAGNVAFGSAGSSCVSQLERGLAFWTGLRQLLYSVVAIGTCARMQDICPRQRSKLQLHHDIIATEATNSLS